MPAFWPGRRLPFGDLVLVDLPFTPEFNGLTIRQLLVEVNTLLGIFDGSVSYDVITALTEDVNAAFNGGVPTQWAQDHLRRLATTRPSIRSTSCELKELGNGGRGWNRTTDPSRVKLPEVVAR